MAQADSNMLDLLIILNAIRGLKRGYRRPLPQNTVREDGPTHIHCPRCHAPQPATIETHERWTATKYTHKRNTLTLYRCNRCRTEYSADRCVDDGTGIFTINPWTCALCQYPNSPASTACENCGAGGAGTGDPETMPPPGQR